MGIRFVARAALVSVIGATLLLGPLGQVDGQAAESLTVTPPTATAPLKAVTLSGECAGIEIEETEQNYIIRYPTMLRVTMVGQQGLFKDIPLEDGRFSDKTFNLPDGLPPGDYEFSAQLRPEAPDSQAAGLHFTPCDPTATLTILPPEVPATVNLDPDRGEVGGTVTATGTCPVSSEVVTVYFGEDSVGSAAVAPDTGQFGPVDFTVPNVDLGPVTVATDCGAEQTFTVTLPTTPRMTTTPPTTTAPSPTPTPPVKTVTTDGVQIVVPDLAGLTEPEVIAALGDRLRLANPTGGTGRVSSQVPPPGTLVEPASAVSVVLASDPDPDRESSWLPLVLVAVAVAVMVAALVSFERLRRRHAREKRWLDSDVRTELQAEESELPAGPDRSVPGLDVRLGVRRDPARLEFQEVSDAHG
jgi:PASTA domain